MTENNSSILKYILVSLIVLAVGFCSFKAYEMRQDYQEYQFMKEEYAFITKIDFGLFNMKEWREKALSVFSEQVENFEISSSAYDEVEIELQKYLKSIYRDYIANGQIFNQIFDDAEKNEKINKMLLKLFRDNVGVQIQNLNIPQYIPSMAKTLGQELQKNEPRIKEVLRGELKQMLVTQDRNPQIDPRQRVYDHYQQPDLESTKNYLTIKIAEAELAHKESIKYIYGGLLGLTLLIVFLYSILGFNLSITLISLISVVFLILGISLPMIDIDARMNSFVFSLFTQELTFDEQSIFYQSKSILQVTKTLLDGRGLDLKIVGIMILLFSIVFPFIKLVLSSIFLYSKKLQNSKLAKGLIFHLGKWSMADVFVVALFMAYIGFYGLVQAQLGQIEQNRGGFGIETVNYSTLAPGALFFATYCVLSIVVGIMINRHQRVGEK